MTRERMLMTMVITMTPFVIIAVSALCTVLNESIRQLIRKGANVDITE
jgi:hypothetical protein